MNETLKEEAIDLYITIRNITFWINDKDLLNFGSVARQVNRLKAFSYEPPFIQPVVAEGRRVK